MAERGLPVRAEVFWGFAITPLPLPKSADPHPQGADDYTFLQSHTVPAAGRRPAGDYWLIACDAPDPYISIYHPFLIGVNKATNAIESFLPPHSHTMIFPVNKSVEAFVESLWIHRLFCKRYWDGPQISEAAEAALVRDLWAALETTDPEAFLKPDDVMQPRGFWALMIDSYREMVGGADSEQKQSEGRDA
ncbi:hypothetical protein CCAX7_55840 [Capsulimonas corticalis]|uniref:Uncharacterized protein n=1 Tax=Capsulimonas corticalis TaxID=2219043 RepID=A0A402D0P4_9BACT|nr:hypothetical protein CCAX7_55840 [Capsulimonas corticalis]